MDRGERDLGLYVVTELFVRGIFWRIARAQPYDVPTVLSAIDARVGAGKIGIWKLYEFDLLDNRLGKEARPALQKAAAATGCPAPGLDATEARTSTAEQAIAKLVCNPPSPRTAAKCRLPSPFIAST